MTKALQDAVRKVERLSEDRQAVAADVLEQIASMGDGVFHVPPEDRAAIEEGIVQADRGELFDKKETALGRSWG